jgi:hypothetical protein
LDASFTFILLQISLFSSVRRVGWYGASRHGNEDQGQPDQLPSNVFCEDVVVGAELAVIMMSKYDFIMFSRINLRIKKHNVLI